MSESNPPHRDVDFHVSPLWEAHYEAQGLSVMKQADLPPRECVEWTRVGDGAGTALPWTCDCSG